MIVEFTASTVQAENGIIVVQFSDDDHYLTFQRDAEFKPNDWGDIHFECDGQGWGDYDVVKCVRLSRDRLHVLLVSDAEEQFAGRTEYSVALEIGEADIRSATEYLRRLFTGTALLELRK
jgi:hypothetical protein